MLDFRVYHLLSWLAWPLFWLLLLRRRWIGKELAFRMRERRGVATKSRPDGPLIWFHGASIGETLSILPLAEHLLAEFPDAEVVITSGTLASADLIASRLPARARHQFLPLDHPLWVDRFLRSWRPDVGIWAESEIWPNLVRQSRNLGIPLHLVNARLSPRSYARWRRRRRFAKRLFAMFDSLIAQTPTDAQRFADLGGRNPVVGGNIKFASQSLPASQTQVAAWRGAFAGRAVWLAANTHAGEEAQVLAAHDRLQARHPTLLTLIAPRHLERLADLQAGVLKDRAHALFSEGPDLVSAHSLLLVDRLGVLGPFYQTCGIALVAGSLIPGIGGHSPIEPARNGAAVLAGQHMDNQADLVALFTEADALVQISDAESLVDAVDSLLSDTTRRSELQSKARALVEAQADVLRLYSGALVPKVRAALAQSARP